MGQTDEKVLRIQKAFMGLYARNQLHEISVKKLCEEVGITRTAFYYYFSDIYEVLESVEDQLIHDLKQINTDFYAQDFYLQPKDQFVYFYDTLDYIRDHSDWFRILMNKSRDGQFIYKWKKIMNEDFSKKYHRDKIVLENEPLVLEMISSACVGAYNYWVHHLEDISREVVAKEVLYRICRDFITD